MQWLLPTTMVLLLYAASPGWAGAGQKGPTFDCAKASGQVETLICKDEELAALDRRMGAVYAAALKNWPANIAAEQRASQRGWIKGRNDCWKSEDVRACVLAGYRGRIVELQITSGQLEVPKPVGYTCAGSENRPFTVTFYQQTDPPSAVITYGDDQVIAFAAVSASGAKYTAANVEFWEHQGEARVNWYGTTLTCKAVKP
jgi:uncharacterized protein